MTVLGELKAIVLAVDRLHQVETKLSAHVRDTQDEQRALRQEVSELRERLIRLEGRVDQVMVQAGATAQAAAALAVAGDLGALRERLAVLEARTPPALPRA